MLHMKRTFFMLVAAVSFFAIGAVHGAAILYSWPVMIGPWVAPSWALWSVVVIGFLMGLAALRQLR